MRTIISTDYVVCPSCNQDAAVDEWTDLGPGVRREVFCRFCGHDFVFYWHPTVTQEMYSEELSDKRPNHEGDER